MRNPPSEGCSLDFLGAVEPALTAMYGSRGMCDELLFAIGNLERVYASLPVIKARDRKLIEQAAERFETLCGELIDKCDH